MSEHVDILRTTQEYLYKTLQGMAAVAVDKAADHLGRLEAENARLLEENRELHEAMRRDEAMAIMANARETICKLNAYCAALRASTQLLRDMLESYITQPKLAKQIAANEAALGGAK